MCSTGCSDGACRSCDTGFILYKGGYLTSGAQNGKAVSTGFPLIASEGSALDVGRHRLRLCFLSTAPRRKGMTLFACRGIVWHVKRHRLLIFLSTGPRHYTGLVVLVGSWIDKLT